MAESQRSLKNIPPREGLVIGLRHFDFATDSRMVEFFEVGYKSVGVLEGYSLDSSPISMVRVGFHE